MKRKDGRKCGFDEDWQEIPSEREAAELLDGQTEELLAAEFFAEQAEQKQAAERIPEQWDNDFAKFDTAAEVWLPVSADLADVAVSEKTAAGAAEEMAAMDFVASSVEVDRLAEQDGADIAMPRMAEWQKAGDDAAARAERQNIVDIADEAAAEKFPTADRQETDGFHDMQDGSGAVAASPAAEIDYNAVADRVYDLLLRQIRLELAGSGAVTE